MKLFVLVVAVLLLLVATPVASAGPDPVCGGQSAKSCVLYVADQLFGECPPLYENVRECDPHS